MKIFTVNEEISVPGTDVILEAGDVISVNETIYMGDAGEQTSITLDVSQLHIRDLGKLVNSLLAIKGVNKRATSFLSHKKAFIVFQPKATANVKALLNQYGLLTPNTLLNNDPKIRVGQY
jgi:hypothetical protein